MVPYTNTKYIVSPPNQLNNLRSSLPGINNSSVCGWSLNIFFQICLNAVFLIHSAIFSNTRRTCQRLTAVGNGSTNINTNNNNNLFLFFQTHNPSPLPPPPTCFPASPSSPFFSPPLSQGYQGYYQNPTAYQNPDVCTRHRPTVFSAGLFSEDYLYICGLGYQH